MDKGIIQIARSLIGIRETPGIGKTPEIMRFWEETGIKNRRNADEEHWCMVAAMWIAKEAGKEYKKSARARDALFLGQKIDLIDLKPGDLVIFWRGKPRRDNYNEASGHVGYFERWSTSQPDKMVLLSGNLSDEFKRSYEPVGKVLACRRLRDVVRAKVGITVKPAK